MLMLKPRLIAIIIDPEKLSYGAGAGLTEKGQLRKKCITELSGF
jgi:hypothetical protein